MITELGRRCNGVPVNLGPSGPVKKITLRNRYSVLVHAVLWGALLALYFTRRDSALGQLWIGGLLLGTGAFVTARDPVAGVSFLGCAALLGPMIRSTYAGAMITIGDFYVLVVIVALLGHQVRGNVKLSLGNAGGKIFTLIACVLTSWLFTANRTGSHLTMVNVAQILLVYVATVSVVKKAHDVRMILGGWLFASTLAAIAIVYAYASGETLLVDASAEFGDQFGNLIQVEQYVFYRASYFYAGAIFPLAVGAVSGVAIAVTSSGRFVAALSLFSVVAVIVALALLGNMTAIVGSAFGVMILVSVLWLFKICRIGVLLAIPLTVMAVTLGGIVVSSVMSEDQHRLLLQRFSWSKGGTDSLVARFDIWESVITYIRSSPKVLLVGLGPDVTKRAISTDLVQGILNQGEQQAVDSGVGYMALNFGLIATGIIGWCMFRWHKSILRLARILKSAEASLLFVCGMVWMCMSVTQEHGVGKPVFCLMQIVACGQVVRRWRLLVQDNSTPTLGRRGD